MTLSTPHNPNCFLHILNQSLLMLGKQKCIHKRCASNVHASRVIILLLANCFAFASSLLEAHAVDGCDEFGMFGREFFSFLQRSNTLAFISFAQRPDIGRVAILLLLDLAVAFDTI